MKSPTGLVTLYLALAFTGGCDPGWSPQPGDACTDDRDCGVDGACVRSHDTQDRVCARRCETDDACARTEVCTPGFGPEWQYGTPACQPWWQATEQDKVRPLDLFLVVDEASAACPTQLALRAALDPFLTTLAGTDLHLAVIGAQGDASGAFRTVPGTFAAESCPDGAPDTAHCPASVGPVMRAADYRDASGEVHAVLMAEHLGCLALVGDSDATTAHSGLDALHAALAMPEQVSAMLRPDALLGVIYVGERPGCDAAQTAGCEDAVLVELLAQKNHAELYSDPATRVEALAVAAEDLVVFDLGADAAGLETRLQAAAEALVAATHTLCLGVPRRLACASDANCAPDVACAPRVHQADAPALSYRLCEDFALRVEVVEAYDAQGAPLDGRELVEGVDYEVDLEARQCASRERLGAALRMLEPVSIGTRLVVRPVP